MRSLIEVDTIISTPVLRLLKVIGILIGIGFLVGVVLGHMLW